MINTGHHHKFADSDEYFAYSPGPVQGGGGVAGRTGVKLVGIDVQALDHPLGTKLINHGPGPSHPHLLAEYRARTGRDAMEDFPLWEPAHKTLMIKGGIPGIENVGGDLDAGDRDALHLHGVPVALDWRRRLPGAHRRAHRSGAALPH
jgi:kynurenine formamidase